MGETTIQLPTPSEVGERCAARKEADMFGFEWQEYIPYMEVEEIKKYLKEGATPGRAKELQKPLDRDALIAEMLEYMEFAWRKANDCRGISAGRSLAHYVAWTWLAGDRELSEKIDGHYEFYGKPQLIMICEHYGWDHSQWDDKVRTNTDE